MEEHGVKELVGPMTKARAKHFKEQLSNFIQKIQSEEISAHYIEEHVHKLTNIIQVAPTQHGDFVPFPDLCQLKEIAQIK